MISTQDLYKEIGIADELIKSDKVSEVDKTRIKLATINLKLLHNVRTNMVRMMEHFKIEKVKPKRSDEATQSEK